MDQRKKHGVLLLVKPAFLITSRNCGQRDLIGNDWEEGSCSSGGTALLARVSHMFALIFSTSDVDQTDIIQRPGPKLCVPTPDELVPRANQSSSCKAFNVEVIKLKGMDLKDVNPDEFVKYGLGSSEHLAANGDRCAKEAREKI
ncbi:Diacylglycerol kinase 7-like protein [Drosera capensis]